MATMLKQEELLEHLGTPGKYQLLIVGLCAINWFYFAFNHISLSYYTWTPEHHCIFDNTLTHFQKYKIYKIDSCNVYVHFPPSVRAHDAINCQELNGWIYDKDRLEKTVVTEWNLICQNSYFVNLNISIYFIGLLLGSCSFRWITARFGRKRIITASFIVTMALNFCLFFVPNFVWFTVLRFIIGFLLQGIQNANYFLLLETVCSHWRFIVTVVVQVTWSIAIMCLAGLAYAAKDWKYMQLVFGFHGIICLIMSIFLPESLRWLIAVGKSDEFKDNVQRIAKFNGLTLEKRSFLENIQIIDEFNNNRRASSLTLLEVLKIPKLRCRVLSLGFISFSCGIIYMGLTLDAMHLPGNKYLNLCLMGAVEIPPKVVTSLFLKRNSRKKLLLILLVLATGLLVFAGSMQFIIVSREYSDFLATLLALLVKGIITAVISICNIYVKELFPAYMRSGGLRFYSSSSELGNCFSGQVLFMSHSTFSGLSSVIFGGLAALSLSILFFISEKPLPDSVEDLQGIRTYPNTDSVKETAC